MKVFTTKQQKAYINTKRLTVTEMNTLLPQVFENAEKASATWKLGSTTGIQRLKKITCLQFSVFFS